MFEIISWEPTIELRWYTPDAKYMRFRLYRRFLCTANDGTSGHIWAEVFPESPFTRVQRVNMLPAPRNVESA